MTTERDILLAPHVLDRQAVGDLIETLRSSSETARRDLAELRTFIERSATERTATARAAGSIQEQLRLGARLMKAMQGQLQTVEQAMTTLRGIDSRLGEVEQRTNTIVEQARADMTRETEAILDRIHEAERKASDRLEAALAAEQRLDERIARLEEIEAAVKASCDQHETLLDRADASQQSLGGVVEQARHAADHMASDLNGVSNAIRALDEHAELAWKRHRRMKARVREIRTILKEFTGLDELAGRIDAMLGRLEPWSELLLDEQTESIDRRVRGMVEQIHAGILPEIGRVAQAMRGMAEQAEQCFGTLPMTPTPPTPPAQPVDPDLAPIPTPDQECDAPSVEPVPMEADQPDRVVFDQVMPTGEREPIELDAEAILSLPILSTPPPAPPPAPPAPSAAAKPLIPAEPSDAGSRPIEFEVITTPARSRLVLPLSQPILPGGDTEQDLPPGAA